MIASERARQADIVRRSLKKRARRREPKADSVLTAQQVREIRRMRGSLAKIARLFGVSASAVGKIKRRESWAWLP